MLWVVLNAESYLLSNTVILWWLMPSDVTLLSNLPSLPGHKISSSVPQGEPPNRTAAKWTTWQWNRWQWGPTKWLMRYSNTQYTHTILLSLPFFSDCVWNFIKRIFYSKVLASNVKPRRVPTEAMMKLESLEHTEHTVGQLGTELCLQERFSVILNFTGW